MSTSRPVGIDLFSGAGGLSLGFEQAGFDIAAAVEIDPVHAAVHKYNFPECAVLARSVVGLSGDEIKARAGLGRRPVDVVFGGAPCQGFSLIGQRVLDDPRNNLVREFVRLVAELNAPYFVFENVKGLTLGTHKQFLLELIEAFHSLGYQVRLPWQVLNAADYGVPQRRERLFLVGAREGLPLPAYPAATTYPADSKRPGNLFGLRRGPTCRDALADIPDASGVAGLADEDEAPVKRWGRTSPYGRLLRCATPEAWFYGYVRKWNATMLTSSMRTEHSQISRRRFAGTREGAVEPISRFFKLPADGLSNTLRAGTDSARGAFTSPRPIHYEHPRCITVREMARLHGFPDWFRFHRTKWHGARQIGNAVSPPVARVVASQVLHALGGRPSRPRRAIALGDPALLRYDMSKAAEHWGIDVNIGRRDRKSGAKKRTQQETEAERIRGLRAGAYDRQA